MTQSDGNHRDRGWVDEVVRRIRRGQDVEAHFELLFRAYEPQIRSLLHRQGWYGADRDDLVQDVMLRVYRGIGTFRLDASFDTWILQIMSNAHKNAIRNRNTLKARAARTSLDSLLASDGDRTPVIAEPESTATDPFDATRAAELKARLAAAIDRLPERMRQCLLLSYRGFRTKEIATAQGVSVNTVKKQIGEGRRRLRPLLGDFVEHFGIWLVLGLLQSLGPWT